MATSKHDRSTSVHLSILPDAGLSELMAGALGFLEKLAGPAAEELGQRFADSIRFYRFKNQIRVFDKTKALLDKAGISASQVPLRTLVPLLDGASLEDEPLLQDMWAALLANAGSSRRESDVPPAYPEIMRQLSPLDARTLSVGFTLWGLPWPAGEWWQSRYTLTSKVGEEHIQASVVNLERLGLISVDVGLHAIMRELEGAIGQMVRHSNIKLTKIFRFRTDGFSDFSKRNEGDMALTTLGVRFLLACSPPLRLPLQLPVTPQSPRNDIFQWIDLAGQLAVEFKAEAVLSKAFSEGVSQGREWLHGR